MLRCRRGRYSLFGSRVCVLPLISLRMRALALTLLLSLFAACDASGPEIVPQGLEGTWVNVGAEESLRFRTSSDGYRFDRTRNGVLITTGTFATLVDEASSDLAFTIRYSVYTDESVELEMPGEVARLIGDDLTLTSETAASEPRTYTRVD